MADSHRELLAWQRGMDLAVACYSVANKLRQLRQISLASQLERASVSVPANIAEGKGRRTRGDYARFLSVALGSLREVETLVELANRLGFAKRETVVSVIRLADEVGRLTFGLHQSLKRAS